ncbi:MAG: TnsA-like heteromeric transposase endonuclease subunit [Ferrimicrobium sp.]
MVQKFVKLEYRSSPQELATRERVQELVGLPLENAVPFRSFSSYRAKHNYEGVYPFHNLNTQVEFESLLEGQFLLQLDWENTSTALTAQPFRVYWDNDSGVRSHIPDYFCRLDNGDGLVVDVRPEERVDDAAREAFEFMQRLCEEVGWEYRIYGNPDTHLISNLRVFKQYAPFECEDVYMTSILGAAVRKTSITDLISFGASQEISDGVTRSLIYRLLWEQRLQTDYYRPLSSATEVWA